MTDPVSSDSVVGGRMVKGAGNFLDVGVVGENVTKEVDAVGFAAKGSTTAK